MLAHGASSSFRSRPRAVIAAAGSCSSPRDPPVPDRCPVAFRDGRLGHAAHATSRTKRSPSSFDTRSAVLLVHLLPLPRVRKKRLGWSIVHPSRRTDPNRKGLSTGFATRRTERELPRAIRISVAELRLDHAGRVPCDLLAKHRFALHGSCALRCCPFRIRAIGTLHDGDLLRPCRHSGGEVVR
jgi:hypothetical protein